MMKQAQYMRTLLSHSRCQQHCQLQTAIRTVSSGNFTSVFSNRNSLSALSHQHVSLFSSSSVRWFGQPVAQTHPHLLNEGEVTPNITKEEYRKRRSALVGLACNLYKKSNPAVDHIFIFPSACKVYMTNDIPYPFRQNSDFLYVSGFQEPSSVLVVHAKRDSPPTNVDNHTSILFVQQKDAHSELWEGPRSGTEGSVQLTGVDLAQSFKDLDDYLYEYCKGHDNFVMWYDYVSPPQNSFHMNVMSHVIGEHRHKHLENTTRLTHALRVRKSPAEIQLMRQTCRIASDAFVDVMKFSQREVSEAHLWAKMDFECRVKGAQFLAYPPVVAGGNRANTIHYTANNQVIADGDLVLMDAGCEFHGYTSDITRTWPVNGKFTPAQRELYQAVLSVQTACIALCTTKHSLDDVYRQMLALLGLQLQALGIVSSDTLVSDVIAKARRLCPHHVGHYLGMDVHDTGDVSRSMKMEPGMIVTVEPGIYVRSDDTTVAERYRGVGIRIEDNILITDTTPINLSESCPKRIEDIEKIMSQR